MNISKSVNVALAKEGETKLWLSEQMGVSVETIYRRMAVNNPTSVSIQKFADVFNMKPSEFVALGE